MPLAYLVSAIWADNDGSMLFWAWLLSIFAIVMVLQRRELRESRGRRD
jgi:cytochrome c-type biogenesis protein CcmF